jgi:DNA-binding Lrp family transcriptional regulator
MDIIAALTQDCRRPIVEVADMTNLSPSTVNRRLARLEADRSVVYRCDFARDAAGWPVEVIMWANVTAERLPRATAQLAGMRETRFCATLTGRSNVIFGVRLRPNADSSELEARIRRHIPELLITDRALTLRTCKIGGNVVDSDGRLIRPVPVGAWQPGIDHRTGQR